jgi:precorrin-6A synthase
MASAIATELTDDGVGAFLVWGDPSLYDSTLRIIDDVLVDRLAEFEHEVIPGITSVQALAAAHRVPLHGIGEPVLVTTGRQLGGRAGIDPENRVVMLDSGLTFNQLDDPEDFDIFWGAYVGMDDEVLISGRLSDVADRIVAERTAARERHGWIMDTYLLRHRPTGDDAGSEPAAGARGTVTRRHPRES